MAFLSKEELEKIGFKSLGDRVFISDKASIYNPHLIEIGNNVRIDDFVILSPTGKGIILKNYIHIGCHSTLIGKGLISFGNFSGTSGRVSVYSSNDDYSGNALLGPDIIIPPEFKNITHGDVIIGNHVPIGSGSIILPNVTIEDGAAIGALTVVRKNVLGFTIVQGNPMRKIGVRSKKVLDLAKRIVSQEVKS